MPRDFTPKMITANALLSGHVVYLTEDDRWSDNLQDAAILTDEADAQIRLLDASARSSEVVGVYLVDVRPTPKGVQTTHFRETFRATGPGNYAHGKQVEAPYV